jgi:hypothetical protein
MEYAFSAMPNLGKTHEDRQGEGLFGLSAGRNTILERHW